MDRVKCPQCGHINEAGGTACVQCRAALPRVNVQVQAPPRREPTPPVSPRAGEFRKGQLVANRYLVHNIIGRGGMGCIYKVHDNALNEVAALKTLLPQFVSEQMVVERFFNEARIARQLSHPNIVRVHDIGSADGIVYISMEFIPGKSLRGMMDDLPPGQILPLDKVLKLFDQLCAALDYAHRYTVHRDIKPENVMIGLDGRMKLMDFGISKLMNNSNMTAASMVMGTPHYMSPEQLRNSAKVDARADIYSVGVMLYEVVTGRTPTLIVKSASGGTGNVPAALDPIIAKCLDPDPEKRYQSAAELGAALRAVAAGITSPGTSSDAARSRAAYPGSWAKRLAGVVLLAAIVLSAYAGIVRAEKLRKEKLEGAQAGAANAPAHQAAPSAPTPQAEYDRMKILVERAKKMPAASTSDWTATYLPEAEAAWADALASEDSDLNAAKAAGWRALNRYTALAVWPDGMTFVPEGIVSIEDPATGAPSEVNVGAFFIDVNEVTEGDFSHFGAEWRPGVWNTDPDSRIPIARVAFYDAQAYAASIGKQLPTEPQWARAASNSDGSVRDFPTGDSLGACVNVNSDAPKPAGECAEDKSPFGCLDLYGNVMEWTRSINAPFPYDPAIAEDPQRIMFGTAMVLRGGSFADTDTGVYNRRIPYVFEGRGDSLGFRCVYELPSTLDGIDSLLARRRL